MLILRNRRHPRKGFSQFHFQNGNSNSRRASLKFPLCGGRRGNEPGGSNKGRSKEPHKVQLCYSQHFHSAPACVLCCSLVRGCSAPLANYAKRAGPISALPLNACLLPQKLAWVPNPVPPPTRTHPVLSALCLSLGHPRMRVGVNE